MESDCGTEHESDVNIVAKDLDVKCTEEIDGTRAVGKKTGEECGETKTVEPIEAVTGIASIPPKDGNTATNVNSEISNSIDCDNKDEKSAPVNVGDAKDGDNVESTDEEVLLTITSFVETVEEQEGEEEQCESSSPTKGDTEVISDTDDYNVEEEEVEDEEENTSSMTSGVEALNQSKEDSDAEDEHDETIDDHYIEDEEDDDVELIPDSSDEEYGLESRNTSSELQNVAISEEDDDDDDDYDDDLMNSVIMSTKNQEDKLKKKHESSFKEPILERRREPGRFKRKLQWNHRVHLKKRSVKWLAKRIRKESTNVVQYIKNGLELKLAENSSPLKPGKLEQRDLPLISLDSDDSPEKSGPSTTTSTPTNQHTLLLTNNKVAQSNFFDMQQVDKIRDTIQNPDDLKQQKHIKTLKDDQNKENVENNDKLLSNSLKVNGNIDDVKIDENPKEIDDNNVKMEIVELSTEDDDNNAKENLIVGDSIKTTKSESDEKDKTDEETNKDGENVHVEGLNTKNANEAVQKELVTCESTETTQEKNNYKDNQPTDLKKSLLGKRSRSTSVEDQTKDDPLPTKKLRVELESNFPTHDRILSEYIEKTSNNSIEDLSKHINQLTVEIQTLNDMIKAKEIEWNNMLHLKKVKEEIWFRLSRKKQMMEIMTTKIGEANLSTIDDFMNETLLQNSSGKPTKLLTSTPNPSASATNFNINLLNNLNSINTAYSSSNICGGTAQSILQNRANMKSSDLAKEKANTQRLHRNILPKPSSSSTAVTGFGASQQGSISAGQSSGISAAVTTSNTGLLNIPLSLTSGTGTLGLNANGTIGNQQPILNSYLTAAATVQQQLGEMLNGHHIPTISQSNTNGGQTLMVGRQGVFKDVKSIIADFRQRHPEVVPRRGRRVKSNPSATDSSSILSNVLKNDGKLTNNDLGALLTKFDGNSRPSSNDSSHSMTNLIGANTNNATGGNVSFKDVLLQFVKMNNQTDRLGLSPGGAKLTGGTSTNAASGSQSAPPPYPEVTLHPVSTSQSNTDQTGSLLHGILTKFSRPNMTTSTAPTSTSQTTTPQNFSSSFSPTLARLLTAPERITTGHNPQAATNSYQTNLQAVQSAVTGTGLNLSKVVGHNSEITITPVISSQPLQQTLLQQQLQQQQLKDAIRDHRAKGENLLNLDDEADDSVDRLVIDEGGDSGMDEHHRIAPHAIGQEFHENEVPACQGCKKQEAQFVCAGCGNQWYCSRECQVAAWDEHSEVCTG